jgi:glucose uptake protein GlcU
MRIIVQLVVAALFGVICYGMAEKRGRNTTTGAILGFLFGIFAVIGYAIAGDKK